MKQTLSNLLEIIGSEIHDTGFVDASGTIRPITKDEQLAREIWRRALGYEEEIENEDGTVLHRIFPADPKMQQFLIERREGKFVTPQEKNAFSLLERISKVAISQMNTAAKDSVDDSRNDS